MYVIIKYTDGTEEKEYANDYPRVKDSLLIIPKGDYQPSLYINMQVVKSFQRED